MAQDSSPTHAKESAREPGAGDDLGVYRLEALAGEGGMGRVFRAVHRKLGRHVALKLLRRKYAARPDAIARFFQEARAVNVIRHPGIVEITDFVEGQAGGDSYYIMEWLEGETLEARLARERSLPVPEAAEVGRQVASALAAVHRAGFVHRDLKPENVYLVTRDGQASAKILDFGVALLQGTHDGAVAGTPAYFSPEGAAGRAVDARSDVYSLGVVLYQMLSGALPFEADSLSGYVMKHMTARARPLSEAATGVPEELGAVVDRCLAKQPEARFQSMDELGAALGRLAVAPAAPRPRLALWGGGLAAIVAVAAIVLVTLRRPPPAAAPVTPALAPAPVAALPQPVDDGRVEVAVTSVPAGAEVYHEGAVLGRTPCTVRVPRATPELELRLAGHRPFATAADPSHPTSRLEVALEPLPSKRGKGKRVSKTGTINPFK